MSEIRPTLTEKDSSVYGARERVKFLKHIEVRLISLKLGEMVQSKKKGNQKSVLQIMTPVVHGKSGYELTGYED